MIIFGAPSVTCSGSHIGAPYAAEMVAIGLFDALASDYFYPAMLAAIARLVADRKARLTRLWPLVAAHPARASGLTDRGETACGKRADLVLIDCPAGHFPAIRRTLVAGRLAYRADPP